MDVNNMKDAFRLYRLSKKSLTASQCVEWYFADPNRVRLDAKKTYDYLKNVQGETLQQ